ncbi:aldo/keto reductase [Amycolatopsis pithecellobii]|uniref:Aldo/keto reductase n=1 Tax=Amycolatopsis pithecellobii TaxID=664692 RepID=A0A6N7YRG5_9PSEU|nr:aldo/keto reductase [Amycolatopsis pithecellobii]MTD54498.1 aldo/keto reductase [Amycolatopsis pithecellobii]
MSTTTLAGRSVARIGFGAMQLAEAPGRQAVDEQVAVRILRLAVERGINHIDTAQFYGDGTANARIRAALHPYPDDLLLVSKVGAKHGENGAPALAQRPEELRASVEANLATLGAEQLAVVNLRRADNPPGVVAEGDQLVDIDSQLAELIALRDEGKIGAIGLSAVNAAQLEHALPAGIACVQNAYSVLDRGAEPVLELCRKHDVAWVPYFPLGSAFPGAPNVADQPAVRAAADAIGVTPTQIALAWLLARYERTLLIAGTANPDHLAENIAAGDLELDADTIAELDGIGAESVSYFHG